MNETELERLVVRLTGDGSSYMSMMDQAQAATTQATEHIKGLVGNIEGFVGAAAAALAGLGLQQWLQGTLAEWDQAEQATVRMTAVLQANGREVDALSREYQEFASSVQETTIHGDEAILNLVTMAESYDLTGESARAATSAALAFAAVTGGSAQSMLRLTAALEKGDIQMAMRMGRLVPQLRGIKDQTEFLERANRLISTGMNTLSAQAETYTGKLTQLANAYGDLKEEIGRILADFLAPVISGLKLLVSWLQSIPENFKKIATAVLATLAVALLLGPAFSSLVFVIGLALNPIVILATAGGVAISVLSSIVGGFSNLVDIVLGKVAEWVAENRTLILTVAGIAAAVLLLVGTFYTLVYVVGLVNTLLTVLGVYQVVGIAMWGAWNLALLALAGTIGFFNLVYGITQALISGNIGLTALWSAAVVVAKALTWLWTAALSALNVALSGAVMLATVATVGLLAIGFVLVTTAIWAAWQAGAGLFNLLGSFPRTVGPLQVITSIFGEWFGILKDVIRAAKTDMKLAWEILAAGFTLAVAQVKALWPPLWNFIKEGFSVIWRFVRTVFVEQFEIGLSIARAQTNLFIREQVGLSTTMARMQLRTYQQLASSSFDLRLAEAERDFDQLAQRFRYRENEEIRNARANLEALRRQIPEEAPGQNTRARAAQNISEAFQQATKEVHKFDAALYSSVEGYSRYLTQLERFNPIGQVGVGAGAGQSAITASLTDRNDEVRANAMVTRLTEIRDAIQQANNRPGITLSDANLSGGTF